MVSRKTQLAWMAAGGVLCMFTVVISVKVREGNRCAAEVEKGPIAVVPVAPPEKPIEMKPLPQEGSVPLPDIGQAPFVAPSPPTSLMPPVGWMPPVANSTIETPPAIPPIEIKPVTALLPAVQPGPSAPATVADIKDPAPSPTPISPPTPVVVTPPTALVPVDPPSAPLPPVTTPKLTVTAPVAPPVTVSSIAEPGEPPLAPQPGPVVQYHVRQGGEYLKDVARKTLGSSERWIEVSRLNPSLSQEGRLGSGTLVRLPADACIPTDELESVQPLPALRPFKPEPGKPKAVMPLTGTFPCNLDDHRALLLPRSMRDQLGSMETLMISPGADQCLWLTTPAHLDRLAQRLEQSQAKEVDVRTFKRLYFAQTEKVSLTAEGRVIISDRLAQFAGLHQEVVLVGIDDHFELWDVARWKDFTQKKSAAARANIAAEQE